MDDIKEVKSDVKEIKVQVIELVKNSAVHNHLLKEHERRSLALEAKIGPIEKHVAIVGLFLKTGGAVLCAVLIHFVIQYLFK